jgi:hypothetical protein
MDIIMLSLFTFIFYRYWESFSKHMHMNTLQLLSSIFHNVKVDFKSHLLLKNLTPSKTGDEWFSVILKAKVSDLWKENYKKECLCTILYPHLCVQTTLCAYIYIYKTFICTHMCNILYLFAFIYLPLIHTYIH